MDLRGRLFDPATILTFMLAGNATLTLRSVATMTRYTYRVRRAGGDDPGRPWFVSVLYGPDNTSDYVYVGIIRPGTATRGGVYELGRKSRLTEDDPRHRAFDWFFRHVQRIQLPPNCEVWHEGHCGRCGRPLTVPESIARGLGPECAGIIARAA